MKRVAVLLNPRSGLAPNRHSRDWIADLFAARGLEAEIWMAQGDGDLSQLAAKAVGQGCPAVVAGGGDGSVSAVAAALVNTGAALGVLPLGTLNHFARDLRIPLDPGAAVDVIARGKIARIDAAEVNGRAFINNSSIGIYPNLVVVRERERRKGRSKWAAFGWAALTMLRRFPFSDVRIHAQGRSIVQRTPFVFVGNNQYKVEGVEIGTRASIDGGRLWVYLAGPISRAGLIWMALTAVFGRLDQTRRLSMTCVDEAWIETRRKRIRVSADGEVAAMRSPLHYRALPGALNVIVP